jgi:hypothetical protein
MSEFSDVLVSFRLLGDDLDPEAVTASLGIVPTSSHAKDSPNPSRNSPNLRHRTGVWLLESALPRTVTIGQHLEFLVDQLERKADSISALGEQGYRVEFVCALFIGAGQEGTIINARLVEAIASFGASLSLSVYCDAESTEPV